MLSDRCLPVSPVLMWWIVRHIEVHYLINGFCDEELVFVEARISELRKGRSHIERPTQLPCVRSEASYSCCWQCAVSLVRPRPVTFNDAQLEESQQAEIVGDRTDHSEEDQLCGAALRDKSRNTHNWLYIGHCSVGRWVTGSWAGFDFTKAGDPGFKFRANVQSGSF